MNRCYSLQKLQISIFPKLFSHSNSTKSLRFHGRCSIQKASFSSSFQENPHQSNTEFSENVPSSSLIKPKHPYRRLFPWSSELELVHLLHDSVVYNQGGLVALVKPYGLGIYHENNTFQWTNKGGQSAFASQNQPLLARHIHGSPRFCVASVLEYLAQLLAVPKLRVVKALNRDYSGLLLLATNEHIENQVTKSMRRAKASLVPYMSFLCITSGLLQTPQKEITERCGISLYEVDELGDHKEPVYVPESKMTKNIKKNGTNLPRTEGPIKPVLVRTRTLATNTKLAVSLVQLDTTVTKWQLPQCYLAYKTAFVLGDTFFSHRVKHILGTPMALKPLKQTKLRGAAAIDPSYEPLSPSVLQALGVKRNREIPLMIHHNQLIMPGLGKIIRNSCRKMVEGEQVPGDDLQIKTPSLPDHFRSTLERLDLEVQES